MIDLTTTVVPLPSLASEQLVYAPDDVVNHHLQILLVTPIGILATLSEGRLECAGARRGNSLIAIDQIEQRHWLRAQRMDDVVVDDVAMLTAALWRPTTPATPRPTNDRL